MRKTDQSIVDWIKQSDRWKKKSIYISYNYINNYRDNYGDWHGGYYKSDSTLTGYYTSLMQKHLKNPDFKMSVIQNTNGENGLYAFFNSTYVKKTYPTSLSGGYIITKAINTVTIYDKLLTNGKVAWKRLVEKGGCKKSDAESVEIWNTLVAKLENNQLTELLTAHANNGKTPIHILIKNALTLTPLVQAVFEKIGNLSKDLQHRILGITDNGNRTILHDICAFWDAKSVGNVVQYLNKDVIAECAEICDLNGHNFLHEAFINATDEREALPSTLWAKIIDSPRMNDELSEGEPNNEERLRLLRHAAAIKTRENYTCLHFACRSHNVSAFKTLQSGMRSMDMYDLITFKNNKGWQPMHYATRSGNDELISLVSSQIDSDQSASQRQQYREQSKVVPLSSDVLYKRHARKECVMFDSTPQSKQTPFHHLCGQSHSKNELDHQIGDLSAKGLYDFYGKNGKTLEYLAHKNPYFSKIDFRNEIHQHTVFMKAMDYFKNYHNNKFAKPNKENYKARFQDFCQLLENILKRQSIIDTDKRFFAKKHWFFKGYERYQVIQREILSISPKKRTVMAERFLAYLKSEGKSSYNTIAEEVINNVSLPQQPDIKIGLC